MPVQISVAAAIDAPLGVVYDAACAIDPRVLIQKRGPLPGIADVEGHDAPWSEPGQKRHHILSDKSSVDEELVSFTRDSTFAYKLTNFTGAIAPLIKGARAEWHFTQIRAGRTEVGWSSCL